MKFSVKEFWTKHPIISNFILIIITGFIILWGVLLYLDSWTMHGATAVVPQVKHMTYNEARATLAANKLTIEISDSIYDRTLPPGTIVESWPKAGAIVKEGRQVYVTTTAFSPKNVSISMPLTGNVSSRQAMSYLRGIGITDIRLVNVPSEYPDLVVGARYGDTPLKVGSVIPVTSTVTLEVGSGPAAAEDGELLEEETIDEFTIE
ncbi:MAG: PASTA domain-containing protein [Bacteroidales bacterium]|nr:PASTA domain-containing protein [Bacteroidales bacterium]MBD5219663.1 PASTA domain-containing protein [Bacteroidales bacterium]